MTRTPVERGTLGVLPYGAIGHGPPIVVVAGLSPTTGVGSDRMVAATLGPLTALAPARRLIVVNRRPGLPRGMTMAQLAAEHAAAIREGLAAGAVDVVGISTGGSIAQQLAADHPDVVRRLVLVSTACRLGPVGQRLQRRVGELIRAGRTRAALAAMTGGLVPPWRGRTVARAVGFAVGPRLLKSADLDDMATTIEAEDEFDLARLPTVGAPTTVLAGSEDRFYSPDLFAETARLIPDCRLELFDGRGHVTVMMDRRFRAAIRDLLAGG
ncbi:MAG: alpha/beta fold hydrolase [Jatrophihabitans sp.]|nr:MAG: alpha/beta fold hydrolase [Jatrophihabitans sp.]